MKSGKAFTLMELLVIIAIIAILAALLLPVLSKTKQKAGQTICLNNLRQLQLGWGMYAQDFGENLPRNSSGIAPGKSIQNPGWVAGYMWLDSDVTDDKTDSTNTDLLVGNQYAAFGSIGGYIKTPAVYHCPADESTVRFGSQALSRVRSVSLNGYLGALIQIPGFQEFKKMSDLTVPGPSDTWVFMDEREDSINDGLFAVNAAARYAIVDYPANYHTGGSCLSFADGHTEYHRWLESTTKSPVIIGSDGIQRLPGGSTPTSPNDNDMAWLVSHTTSKN